MGFNVNGVEQNRDCATDEFGMIWKEVAHFKVLCHNFSEGTKSYG